MGVHFLWNSVSERSASITAGRGGDFGRPLLLNLGLVGLPQTTPPRAAALSTREDAGAVQVKEFYLDGKKRAVLNQNITCLPGLTNTVNYAVHVFS